jgi:hypothetical protein
VEDEALVKASRLFEQAKASNDYRAYCQSKAETATTGEERQVHTIAHKEALCPAVKLADPCALLMPRTGCALGWVFAQVWAILQTVVDKDSKSQLNRFLGFEDKAASPAKPPSQVHTHHP